MTEKCARDWRKIDVDSCDRGEQRVQTHEGRGAQLFIKEIKEILFRADRCART